MDDDDTGIVLDDVPPLEPVTLEELETHDLEIQPSQYLWYWYLSQGN